MYMYIYMYVCIYICIGRELHTKETPCIKLLLALEDLGKAYYIKKWMHIMLIIFLTVS